MDHHMRRFLRKFKPAFGYLQSFRGKLPPHIPADIDGGQLNRRLKTTHPKTAEQAPSAQSLGSSNDDSRSQVDRSAPLPIPNDDHRGHKDTPSQSIESTVESAPQPQTPRSLEANSEDTTDLQVVRTSPDDGHIEQEQLPQPSFTDGPSRFVSAKDGSRDCVALLVNETFLAKLQHLFNEKRDLRLLDAPLYHARKDTSEIERLMQSAQESLEEAESDERADECRQTLERYGTALLHTRQRRDDLEKEYELIKGNHELSTNHTQWVLETAMREANLLGPEKLLPVILVRQEEIETTEHEHEAAEDEIEDSRNTMYTESLPSSAAPDSLDLPVSPEDSERQAARDNFVQREQALDLVQERFDNQRQNYQENLGKYLQKLEIGATSMSRSAFDRRSVQYGQQLTGALIDAEKAFEEARERAQALGAIGSDYGQDFYYGAEYEESWPENKIAEFNASHDWSFVEGWMDSIPNSTAQADADSVEIDEWDAEEVDVNDSISMMDCEEYRREIDRYRRICARLEDPCPEVRWLGQPDGRPLERRGSCWM